MKHGAAHSIKVVGCVDPVCFEFFISDEIFYLLYFSFPLLLHIYYFLSDASYIVSHHFFLYHEIFSDFFISFLEEFYKTLEALLLPQKSLIHWLIWFVSYTSILLAKDPPNWKNQKCSLSQRIYIYELLNGWRQSTEMSLKEIKSGATLFLILLVSTSQMYANIIFLLHKLLVKVLITFDNDSKIDNFNQGVLIFQSKSSVSWTNSVIKFKN